MTVDHGEPDAQSSLVDEVTEFTDDHRQRARELAGTGGVVDRRRLFTLLREERVSVYPMFALISLSVGGTLTGSAIGLASPDISRTFGLDPVYFAALGMVSQVTALLVPPLVARFVQNKPRRALVLLSMTAVSTLIPGLQAIAPTIALLTLLSVVDGATSAASATVNTPLMIDLFPPQVRVRVTAYLAIASMVANLFSTGIVVFLAGPLGLTWRGMLLAVFPVTVVAFLFAVRVRDPGYGHYDAEQVRKAMRAELDDADVTAPAPLQRPPMSTADALRRLWSIPAIRYACIGTAVGTLPTPIFYFLTFFMANQFSLDLAGRGLIALASSVVGIVSFLLLAPIGDRIFQRSPQRLYYLVTLLGLVSTAFGAAQFFTTSITVFVVISMITVAMSGLSGPALTVAGMTVVPAQLRSHSGVLFGLFSLGGTALGTALLGGLTSQLGVATAVVIVYGVQLVGLCYNLLVAKVIRSDLDAVVDEVVEEEFVAHAAATGRPLPMIAVRQLNYSYGNTQILFNVDFSVEAGEIVALLGVNGAGKSTLLRAISGLGVPDSGSIRLDGMDITYTGAERRTRMGITQVPGGRAVFSDLTVLEHLRCYTFGLPKGEKVARRRIDDALAAFPRLADCVDQRAATLSGGEKQMLGLAKAMVLRPRLLLIDELSLGLAPKVVESLLDSVREINQRGTAVVLVEQSVNVALSVAPKAYFMERGRVAFEGRGEDLRDNTELLRAVFLSGSAAVNR
ncbi:MFS transporter [Streptomyces mirabilis]|uniref:MFS transporter n=1 Tax=Streptomyces mirabilis TaxID=68239 RepID=UPI003317CFE9